MLSYIAYKFPLLRTKTMDIEFSVQDEFVEEPSSGNHSKKIGQQHQLSVLPRESRPKCINKIAKYCYHYLCL